MLDDWLEKCKYKFETFATLSAPFQKMLKSKNEYKRILLHELAYFLNLLPFEVTFQALRIHREGEEYSETLTNILGDSLLDGGIRLDEFYKEFETSFASIGYSPEDLLKFKGASSVDMGGVFRDIIGDLIARKHYKTKEKRAFVKKTWRAACTLHLSAAFQSLSLNKPLWQDRFAPLFYHGIEVGRTEVF